ncbi:hypothetical protein MKW92_009862 [Papaver armeniacum]|nr:hypothetical protein MKW92_009862 [Papaver armeniacum]
MAFKLVPRCFLFTSLAQYLSKLSFSSYVSSDSNELSPANELQLEFREYLKPSLPSLQTSNDADMVANLLIERHDPYNAWESSLLHLNGIRISTELVQQTLIRLKNVPKIALDFFVWAKEQPGYRHDGVAYDMMIDIMGKVQQFDVAWQLLLDIDQLGDKLTSKTFSILFRRLIAAGLTRQAVQAFADMESFTKRETDREDFVYLLDTLCKYGYVKVATEIFNRREFKFEPDTQMYTVLIYGWFKLNRPEVAEKFFEEMVDRGLVPSVVTYNVLLNGICRRTVLHPGTHFKKLRTYVASYSIVLHVYSHAHKPDLSLDKLSSMKEKGIFPTVETYTSVLKCLCSCGRLKDAEEILNEMVANGVSPSPTTFNCFFKEFQGRKYADNALKLYKKMGDLSFGTFSRLNKMDIVQEIWNEMKESGAGPDSDSYMLLIHGLCGKPKWVEACEFVVEMIESGFRPQKITLEKLYKGLTQADMLTTWIIKGSF